MKINNLCAEIGCLSINHYGEQLCGDHIDVVENDGSTIMVLADGMGSGVKASILSTLTSKIISTMLAAGLDIRDAVETIAQTLPVCSERRVAFSTFTIIRLDNNEYADIIQYENPNVLLIRNGENIEFPLDTMKIGEKTIFRSHVSLEDGDIFIAMSDGILHASPDGVYNPNWDRDHVIDFVAPLWHAGFTAKTLASVLIEETNRLYGGKPFDDASVGVIKIRRRSVINIAIGPPKSRDDNRRMMSVFFAKDGKHIVCGGMTANIAAAYLGEAVKMNYTSPDPNIPAISEVNGIDLVTEGIITLDRVLTYAEDYIRDNSTFEQWSYKKDGASLLARMIFEDASDINLFVGQAENPAHKDLPINFNVKMRIVTRISECLRAMGKRVKVLYF